MDNSSRPTTRESLLQQCKQEAKHLLEANATNRKLHWTHPSFISFCTSVDDILSHDVLKKHRTLRTSIKQPLTSSGRVLQELAKTYPVAMSMYTMCYANVDQSKRRLHNKPDYSQLQSHNRVEYRILWIRTAILEKTLKPIVDEILKKPHLYYCRSSILCHSVYSELFSFLLDGPCSLTFSRMKSLDTSLASPGPSEIVNRYNRVLPATSTRGYTTYSQDTLSSEVWGHIQSMYQTSLTTCLYGKNNILINPPDTADNLEGYLTLVQVDDALYLKWLPNALINRNLDDDSLDRFMILSVDVTNDIAHVHCHQSQALNESRIDLIGFNGIAYPAVLFPQPNSMIKFLEAVENGLHPKGCLEPPLWYLKQSNMIGKQQEKDPLNKSPTTLKATPILNKEAIPATWNQVFRVRFSRQVPHHVRDTSIEWETGSEDDPITPISIVRSRSHSPSKSVKRRHSSDKIEQMQSKVSYQLLARYFYSWLSYCRHINRVKTSLSHLVLKPSLPFTNPCQLSDTSKLDKTSWMEFLSVRDESSWSRVVMKAYSGGVSHEIRKEVWPYLLKVIPYNATSSETTEIIKKGSEDYNETVRKWKTIEKYYYQNNDPTSTSIIIRMMGETTTPTKQSPPNKSPDNLIDLDGRDSEEDDIIVTSSDGEIDSGCDEDRPQTGMSCDGGTPVINKSEEGEEIRGQCLSSHEKKFLDELVKIDKDIPRCDRDYWYFQIDKNLSKLRNIISSYIWKNTDVGYSQGMCDLLAPLLVSFDNEEMAFVCFEKLMKTMDQYFPPKPGVQERMNNLRSLLQILEGDFFQYLSEMPMGDSLFYSYRWFLVNFKREFSYNDIFLLWEVCWAAQWCSTMHFEVFVAMAVIQQYQSAIMDAQLDASEILNLFTDLSEKKALNITKTLLYAKSLITHIYDQDCT